jgi:hypothetical protein
LTNKSHDEVMESLAFLTNLIPSGKEKQVEKEGLSSEDNTKIASIKFKFAPMFKMNRIGAKARENEEAKE